MPDRFVFASGELSSGEDWKLTEARSPHSYTTFLTISRDEKTLFSGGMGGQPIHFGQHINVYSGEEDGFIGVVVRVDELVHRVLLRGIPHGPSTEIHLYNPTLANDVRVGGLGWSGPSEFTELVALDDQGTIVSRYPLPHLSARWRRS
jgi:hypothetical protein